MRLRESTSLSVIAFALVALAWSGLSSASLAGAARDEGFFVPIGKRTGFGHFIDGPDDATRLREAFGPPTNKRVESHGHTCVFGWPDIGVRAELVAYGSAERPCREGTFVEAILTDPRWHTASGVRPGSPEKVARRASLWRCTRRTIGCGINGYALELHRTVCATTRSAGVIAHVRGHQVISLIVRWRSCE